MSVAIDGWDEQRTRGVPLSSIPAELLEHENAEDIRIWFKSLQQAGARYRAKICVIGPSSWGKTSLIKSLTSKKPSLERVETRTFGIDLFAWSFETPSTEPESSRRYDVSVWDFAGQEEYRSAHSLFYSKKTLYVVCVNMEAYVDTLTASKIDSSGAKHTPIDTFFDETIYSRVRAICAHEPESEFVFVGTKLDCVNEDTDDWLQQVNDDLFARVNRRRSEEIKQLDRMIEELKRENQQSTAHAGSQAVNGQATLQRLEAFRRLQPKFLSDKLVAMSSSTLFELTNVSNELQRWILASETSCQMPVTYVSVGESIHKLVTQAKEAASMTTQIEQLFVPVQVLVEKVLEATPSVTLESEVRAILRMLYGVGEERHGLRV